ncbi:hypothetical protein [Sulfuracidifex tepidarius]|nr:hypothetical protein [Sulfuracidifex tepidarius]
MFGLIGWGGLTTGAYYMMAIEGEATEKMLKAYRKLVIVEIISLFALAISGIFMWIELGMPDWVYPAFALAPVLAVGEWYHYKIAHSTDFLKKMRFVSIFYTIIAVFLIYDMVFKP